MLGSVDLPQLPASDDAGPEVSLSTALRVLGEREPQIFEARLEELSYLTNILVAGAMNGDHRFRPAEAGQAVLATVQLGAELEATERRGAALLATSSELYDVLRTCMADVLFRKASSALTYQPFPIGRWLPSLPRRARDGFGATRTRPRAHALVAPEGARVCFGRSRPHGLHAACVSQQR